MVDHCVTRHNPWGLDANRVVYAAVLIEPTVFCYEPRELAENLLP